MTANVCMQDEGTCYAAGPAACLTWLGRELIDMKVGGVLCVDSAWMSAQTAEDAAEAKRMLIAAGCICTSESPIMQVSPACHAVESAAAESVECLHFVQVSHCSEQRKV